MLLEDGTTHEGVSKDIEGLSIECTRCHKRSFVKALRKGAEGYLVKPYVCLACHATGENNPFYGKKHPEEFKKRLSKERKGSWCVGSQNAMYGRTDFDVWREKFGEERAQELDKQRLERIRPKVQGKNNHFYGKTHTAESKHKMAVASTRLWATMPSEKKLMMLSKQQESVKRYASQHPERYRASKVKAARKSFAVQNGSRKMNGPESKVFAYLEAHFPNAFEFSVILGFYQFDFGCRQTRTLVEVHGDYWHCNPQTYQAPKNIMQRRKIERDKLKADFARKHSMPLFVIWEKDINQGDFSALKGLRKLMESSTK